MQLTKRPFAPVSQKRHTQCGVPVLFVELPVNPCSSLTSYCNIT